MNEPEFEIINIVGTGHLGREINIDGLNEDLPHLSWRNPEPHPGLNVRLTGHNEYPSTFEEYTADELAELCREDYEEADDRDLDDWPPDIDLPLTTFYRSGKYIIRGVSSLPELGEEQERVIQELKDLNGFDEDSIDDDPESIEVSNIVALGCIDEEVNLQALAIGLGLESVEYEPEQFPALIYRGDDYPCTFLVFASGEIVIPGAVKIDKTEEAFYEFVDEIEKWVL